MILSFSASLWRKVSVATAGRRTLDMSLAEAFTCYSSGIQQSISSCELPPKSNSRSFKLTSSTQNVFRKSNRPVDLVRWWCEYPSKGFISDLSLCQLMSFCSGRVYRSPRRIFHGLRIHPLPTSARKHCRATCEPTRNRGCLHADLLIQQLRSTARNERGPTRLHCGGYRRARLYS